MDKQSEAKAQSINLTLSTLKDIFHYPEPSFIIDPILVDGTVSVLGAYTGVGKSITALSIVKSILTGEGLWGKYPVLKTGPVLLVDEETPDSFLRERIEKMGFDKSLPFYFLHFQNVRLDRDDYFNALLEKIQEVNPVLVVIDSLIRVHRQREDEATSMALVIDRLRRIANSGTTVLVIHHHRKAEGPLSQKLRGSSDIPGGVDVEYAIVEKDGFLVFQSVKTRTKPLNPIKLKIEITDESIEVTYQGVEITEGEKVINEVIGILEEKGKMGVTELHEALRGRDVEIGINAFRSILRNSVGERLIEHTGEKGKKLYEINSASQFNDSIYSREAVKQKFGFIDSLSISDNNREAQTLDNQGLEGSFTASQDSLCETVKLNFCFTDNPSISVDGREAEVEAQIIENIERNDLNDSASQFNGLYREGEAVKQKAEEDLQSLVKQADQRINSVLDQRVRKWLKTYHPEALQTLRNLEEKVSRYLSEKDKDGLISAIQNRDRFASEMARTYKGR